MVAALKRMLGSLDPVEGLQQEGVVPEIMEKKGGIGDRKVFRRLFHNRQEVILKRVL